MLTTAIFWERQESNASLPRGKKKICRSSYFISFFPTHDLFGLVNADHLFHALLLAEPIFKTHSDTPH